MLRVLNIIGAKQRLTPAEKMKRYREKLKKEPEKHVIVKQKDAERKQLSRELERKEESAMSPGEQQKLAERRKETEKTRKRDYRWRLKQNRATSAGNEHGDLDVTPTKVYSSRQAAGKAVQHLRVRLPFSPRKRKAVTLQLALEAGNVLHTRKRTRQGVDKEMRKRC